MYIYFQLDLYLAPQQEPGPKLSARVWCHMLLFVIQGCSVGCISLELKSSTLLFLSSSPSPVTPGQYQRNV